ncbi:MAG: hypothetical protein ACPGWR_16550 [Ardenticatenaceae bacterium]
MMSYLLILFLLMQTTSAQVTVTLLNDQEAPAVSETIELVNEQRQTIGSCVTSANGRCTITVEEVPADPSGFIRGAVVVSGRGQRPVIWPGGPLQITIILDSAGQIFVPSDQYVTKTPESTQTPYTPESTKTPYAPESTKTTYVPEGTKTPKGTEAPKSTEASKSTKTPESNQLPTDGANSLPFLIKCFLRIATIAIATIYALANQGIFNETNK